MKELKILLTLVALLSTSLQAASYNCAGRVQKRDLLVSYIDATKKFPCELKLKSGDSVITTYYSNTVGYCDKKADQMAKDLAKKGMVCTVATAIIPVANGPVTSVIYNATSIGIYTVFTGLPFATQGAALRTALTTSDLYFYDAAGDLFRIHLKTGWTSDSVITNSGTWVRINYAIRVPRPPLVIPVDVYKNGVLQPPPGFVFSDITSNTVWNTTNPNGIYTLP